MTAARRRLFFLLKLAAMAALLWLVWRIAGGTEILSSMTPVAPGWLVAALLVTVPQTLLSSLRWRLVVMRLGGALAAGRAAAEYYIAVFLNQVLPGGVAGDVTRVARHGGALRRAQEGQGYGFAAQAVIYERTAGQIAMTALSIPGLALWRIEAAWIAAAALVGLLIVGVLTPPVGAVGRFVAGFKAAVLAPAVLAQQVVLSAAIAGSYVLVYWFCARGLGIDLAVGIALMILPPALLAMAVPLTPAGWGLREAASVGLWLAAGLPASDAAAVSILYGLVNLAGALPGAGLLLAVPSGPRPAG